MTSPVCVVGDETGLLFQRSHFLLRILLPREPVDMSIYRFLLNANTIRSPGSTLSRMKHNDNCFPTNFMLQNFPGKKENTFKCERRGLVIKEEEEEVLYLRK